MLEKESNIGNFMTIQAFKGKRPRIDSSALVFDSAMIIGDVEIGPNSSVWPGAVIRGDVQLIKIGENTNIQDNVVIHAPPQIDVPVIIGNNVTIGHSAMLHGCQIDDFSLIGIHAVLLDRVKIGSWVIVGAGSIVTTNTTIPSKSLVLGVPGQIIRQLNDNDLRIIRDNVKSYLRLTEDYKSNSLIKS